MKSRSDALYVLLSLAVTAVVYRAVDWRDGRLVEALAVSGLVGALAAILLKVYRLLNRVRGMIVTPGPMRELVRAEAKRVGVGEFAQHEALANLRLLLPPASALPLSRGWAASPDFLYALTRRILETKPALVVEFGSGLSTYWIARALEANGAGRLVSVDHEAEYAEKTRRTLVDAGLERFVEIRVAPLAEQTWPEGVELWYDRDRVSDLADVDLVVVDGPPRRESATYRWPAVWEMAKRLSRGGAFVLDDTNRESERALVTYLHEDLGFSIEDYWCEKGAHALTSPIDAR